jgi:ABC-type Mn2+/Zn2+ transport system permease subunit
MARTLGLRTSFWSLLLFLTFALAISVSTRAIGALPVFAFTVLPPAAALLIASRMWSTFAIAVGLGVASAFIGNWAAWQWQLPTGAAMVIVAALFLLLASPRLALVKRKR